MWPYAAFDWPIAKLLWLVSNLAFTGAILLILFRLAPKPLSAFSRILIGSLFVMGAGWRVTMGNGQHGLFCLGMFLIGLYLHDEGKPGSWLALAASWLKYTISIPLSLLFMRNSSGLRLVLGAVLVNAALIVFCAVWTHSSVLEVLIGPFLVAETTTDRGAGAVDVFAIASRFGIVERPLPAVASLAILVMSFFTVRRDADVLSALSTLAVTSLVVAFHQGYDFVILILPLTYVLSVRQYDLRRVLLLLTVAFGWFIDIGLISIASRLPLERGKALDEFRFWFDVALFYSTLAVSWYEGLRRSPNSERYSEERSRIATALT